MDGLIDVVRAGIAQYAATHAAMILELQAANISPAVQIACSRQPLSRSNTAVYNSYNAEQLLQS